MSIAVDQTKLRRITRHILGDASLERPEAETILQIVQVAAGTEPDPDPTKRGVLQAIGQHVCALVGTKPGELRPVPRQTEQEARDAWLRALGGELESTAVRELAYTLAFLATIADLDLTAAETSSLEELQRALRIDHQRATDLVVFSTELVASADPAA